MGRRPRSGWLLPPQSPTHRVVWGGVFFLVCPIAWDLSHQRHLSRVWAPTGVRRFRPHAGHNVNHTLVIGRQSRSEHFRRVVASGLRRSVCRQLRLRYAYGSSELLLLRERTSERRKRDEQRGFRPDAGAERSARRVSGRIGPKTSDRHGGGEHPVHRGVGNGREI